MLLYSITEIREETSRITAIEERLRISFPRMESRADRNRLKNFRIDIIKFLQEL